MAGARSSMTGWSIHICLTFKRLPAFSSSGIQGRGR
jgi:hypothetical protein